MMMLSYKKSRHTYSRAILLFFVLLEIGIFTLSLHFTGQPLDTGNLLLFLSWLLVAKLHGNYDGRYFSSFTTLSSLFFYATLTHSLSYFLIFFMPIVEVEGLYGLLSFLLVFWLTGILTRTLLYTVYKHLKAGEDFKNRYLIVGQGRQEHTLRTYLRHHRKHQACFYGQFPLPNGKADWLRLTRELYELCAQKKINTIYYIPDENNLFLEELIRFADSQFVHICILTTNTEGLSLETRLTQVGLPSPVLQAKPKLTKTRRKQKAVFRLRPLIS